MKSLKIITVAGCIMFALTGCFKEDYAVCPPEGPGPGPGPGSQTNNVTLNYRLPDAESGSCVFLDNIFSVTTAIYNQDGELIRTIETSDSHHQEFKGIKTYLEPGEYRVISWGNTGTNTMHKAIEYHYLPDADALVTYGTINEGKVSNGDALFYAPNSVVHTRMGTGEGNEAGEYVMTVSAKGHEGTLDFRHAHRHVEVYVKGFEAGGANNPVIQLTDLPHGLYFGGMKPIADGERVIAEMRSEMVNVDMHGNTGRYALAPFTTFYFNPQDCSDINIHLIDPTNGETAYSTRIYDHIDQMTDDPESNETLRILIEFKGINNIEVTIPDWDSKDVDYGYF